MNKQEILHHLENKARFDAVGESIAKNIMTGKEKIFLDCFFDIDGVYHEYIVLDWGQKSGWFEAANAECNSLTADVQQLSQMLNGGFYGQCDDYERYKSGSAALALPKEWLL